MKNRIEMFENFLGREKKKKKKKYLFVFFVTFPNKPGFFRTSGRENYDQRTKRYQNTHVVVEDENDEILFFQDILRSI